MGRAGKLTMSHVNAANGAPIFADGTRRAEAFLAAGLSRRLGEVAVRASTGRAVRALSAALVFALLAVGYALALLALALAGGVLRLWNAARRRGASTSRRWRYSAARDFARWQRVVAKIGRV